MSALQEVTIRDSSYSKAKVDGTRLDELSREFEGPLLEKARALRQWIEETPEAVCFASHAAELRPPKIEGTFIMPILFIRYPLDRIRSAYELSAGNPNPPSALHSPRRRRWRNTQNSGSGVTVSVGIFILCVCQGCSPQRKEANLSARARRLTPCLLSA